MVWLDRQVRFQHRACVVPQATPRCQWTWNEMCCSTCYFNTQCVLKAEHRGNTHHVSQSNTNTVAVLGDLQYNLDTVAAWCNKWGLGINSMKTKILHFRPKRKPCSSFCFHLGDSTLNFAHDYKYLGFWFYEFLDREESISRSWRVP